MTIEILGVDIAKNVFQLHGLNCGGHVVLKRRVMRDQLIEVFAQIDRCTVVIEASTGAFYWARKFEALGHKVKLISPQYVKPFVRRQKNDGNDAEAICTAARQPHIPFVPKKTVEQQDIQALHRARQRMVNHRTAVVSQIRGLLLDRGFAFAKSITRARRAIPEILADQDNELAARPIPITNGSTSFGSGAASTAQRLLSPTKTRGSSGPCFERASHIAPPAEDLPQSLRDDGEMSCTGRTGAQRA